MASLIDLAFDNSFARLSPAFYEVIDPTPLTAPRLVAFNSDVAPLIDLDPEAASDPDAPAYLSGAIRLPGAEPVAMIYAGHQFGVWVPQLGDGRAILLGEVVNRVGERWDLHLKGAGQTRFSRMGDGRAVLRSTIREYLASEAMHGLGIPTTRALSIVMGEDLVYREVPERAAVLIRVAPSHVRFGTFQIFAARRDADRVRELADYVIRRHEPDLEQEPEKYRIWFGRVLERTAEMVARWLAVGFAHGVMNTDNMSVLGLTLDYGPFGFQDRYDPGFICNHSDPEGRYAFDRQPAIAMWNLARFGESLLSLISVADAEAALGSFPTRFHVHYGASMRAKLGLEREDPADVRLVESLLALLAAGLADYTRFFRALATVERSGDGIPEPLRALVPESEELGAWLVRYRARLEQEEGSDLERRQRMNRANPKYVLRNYLAQQAIDRARAGDYGEIERLRILLKDPFGEHPEFERYADTPPGWARELVVSCSS